MPKKILIIEDDRILRTTCGHRLASEGYEVISAADGDEGLAKLREARPDLVLLDILLPKRDGFELLGDILKSADWSTSKIPVIVLSNLGQENDVVLAKSLGAREYLVKADTSLDLLVVKVREMLGE